MVYLEKRFSANGFNTKKTIYSKHKEGVKLCLAHKR
ncbi:MAG: hypothetical protein H6Q14_156 [Bacteroidetes bacterium]|nr:hypothetical protein [Bacteroidota bacterium]